MRIGVSNKLRSVQRRLTILAALAALTVVAALSFWAYHVGWRIRNLTMPWGAGAAVQARQGDVAQEAQQRLAPPPSEAPDERPESAIVVERLRVDLTRAEARPMPGDVEAQGVVTYDHTRLAQLSSRAPGNVWSVQKKVGQVVHKGELLAIVEAPEVGRAKAAFLQGTVSVELKEAVLKGLQSLSSQLVAKRQFNEAQAAAREARIQLFNARQALINLGLPIHVDELEGLDEAELFRRVHFLGLPESVCESLDPETTTGNLLPLLAPFDGILIGREIVVGEWVEPSGASQLEVVDVSRMSLELDIDKHDAPKIRHGQAVVFSIDGMPGKVRGTIDWISTEVDLETRALQARADVDNPFIHGAESDTSGQRLLRANMLGTATIRIDEPLAVIAVGESAVARDEDDDKQPYVFVYKDDGQFERRVVTLGATGDGYAEVVHGLAAGEQVARFARQAREAEVEQQ